jgi:hypothetical protein
MTNHQKSDKYFKWFLFFVALYFLGHIGYALAQTTPPTIQCTSNGMGTIICYPI